MSFGPLHRLTTAHTTAEIEARDTAADPLPFAIDPMAEELERYAAGDDVILYSRDGDTFIGHLERVEYDRLRIYVELD